MASRNPLDLPLDLHFLARNHVKRFATPEGRVSVYRKATSTVIVDVSPHASGLFDAHRVWSPQAEENMGRIERRFWAVLNDFDVAGRISDQNAVTDYFAMWWARARYVHEHRRFTSSVYPLNGITPMEMKNKIPAKSLKGNAVEATMEDVAELRHVGFYSTDPAASARSTSWMVILWWMDMVRETIRSRGIRWGVATTLSPLVLPDISYSYEIPVSPHALFCGYQPSDFREHRTWRNERVSTLNAFSFRRAQSVVVAQNPALLKGLATTSATAFKAGRNDPCPCGSGKKFKRCHGG